MIDVHTHILPNIDDGSKSIDETFQMIQEAYNAGFTDIITTSHYIECEYEVNRYDRQCIIDAIQNKLDDENIKVKLHNGAEAYISNEMPKLVKQGVIPTLGGGKYILFELPLRAKVMYVEQIINKLLEMEYVPVIAHPERYLYVQEEPNIIIDWLEQGALIQSNYASIIGRYGESAKETLFRLLDADVVHFLGTDTHRKNSIYTKMDEILKEYKKKIGKNRLEILNIENPTCLYKNIDIEVNIPKRIKKNKFFSL